MVKPEWGTKRICQECGARFYDMNRAPLVCPKCGAEVKTQAPAAKPRRSRAVAPAGPKAPPAATPEALEPVAKTKAKPADEIDLAAGEEDEDDDFIEDVSELGEDGDDMAEVIEGIDEDGDKEPA